MLRLRPWRCPNCRHKLDISGVVIVGVVTIYCRHCKREIVVEKRAA